MARRCSCSIDRSPTADADADAAAGDDATSHAVLPVLRHTDAAANRIAVTVAHAGGDRGTNAGGQRVGGTDTCA